MSTFSFPSDRWPEELTRNCATMTRWMTANGSHLSPLSLSVEAAAMAGNLAIGMTNHMTGTMFGFFDAVTQASVKAARGNVGFVEPANSGVKPVTIPQIATLEPEDFRRPREMEKPAQPDNLKLIPGIGPKLEQVLNSLGIWTFAQVADWSPNEIAWIDDYLHFKGRVDRDNWTARAAALAAGGPEEYQRSFGSKPR